MIHAQDVQVSNEQAGHYCGSTLTRAMGSICTKEFLINYFRRKFNIKSKRSSKKQFFRIEN